MGFLKNTTGIELTAKLTPEGRKKLISNNNSLITYFTLGDSDSYYGTYEGLSAGQIPEISGNNNGMDASNGGVNYQVRSLLRYNTNTNKKPVEPASISINTTFKEVGVETLNFSGDSITQNIINLNDIGTDTMSNLFYSFYLPITTTDFNLFNNETSQTGGFSDTALTNLAQTKVLVIGIDGDEYSELIDGKSLNLNLTTSASTYSIYGTYENRGTVLNIQDTSIVESSPSVGTFGPNRVLLFSDDVLKPNGGDATKSWSTGYLQNKPFSLNNKELFNIRTNTNTGLVVDEPVGIAYLDKGFIVITNQDIVNSYDVSTSVGDITFNSFRHSVSQSITCIANRGEFGQSTNYTWSNGDVPRITEVGLWDNTNTLIAIGKLNDTYYKPVNDFVAFNITIDY